MRAEAVTEAVLGIDTSRDSALTIVGATSPISIPYQEVADIASRRATGLAEQGIQRGAAVGVYARTSLDFIASCFALWRRGAAVVPLTPPPPRASIDEWTKRLGDAVLAAEADAVLCGRGDPPLELPVRSLDPWTLDTGGSFTDAGPDPTDVAVIQFSSGSTSQPKGVVLEHRALVSYVDGMCRRGGPSDDDDVLVSWLPMFHDLGFVNFMIRPLSTGFPVVLIPTELFIASPLVWLEEMSRHRATITSGPNAAYGLVARELERTSGLTLELGPCRYAGNGGEAVDPETLERFARAAAPYGFDRDSLTPGYGLAEATCSVTARDPRSGWIVDRVDRNQLADGHAAPPKEGSAVATFVSVGRSLDGVEVAVVDADGNAIDDRRVGEVVTRSPNVMRGYLADAEGTTRVLRNGWLHTGDIGYLVKGELFVTGRAKDVIIIGGQNYFAEDVERIVNGVDGVRRGGSVAVPVRQEGTDGLALLIETGAEGEELVRIKHDVASRVLDETGIAPSTILFLEPKALPKTTSGKLRRSQARHLLETGAWADVVKTPVVPARPPIDDVQRTLQEIWREVLSLDDVGVDDDFYELGGTSLQAADVLAEIERRFGRSMPPASFMAGPTIDALSRHLRAGEAPGGKAVLVPLVEGGPRELIAVPGAGGRALPFMALARSMESGVSFSAFDTGKLLERRSPSVEELAAECVEVLRSRRSAPFHLVGYSFGGLVAVEVATQLLEQGEEVSFVGVVDAPDPIPATTAARLRRLDSLEVVKEAVRGRIKRGAYRARAWAIRHRLLSRPRRKRFALEIAVAAGTARAYRPTYRGRIDYFRVVSPGDPIREDRWAHVPADVHVHDVPAPSHDEVMRPPWVEGLARALRDALEEVQR